MRKRGLRHYNMPVFLILLLVSVVMIFPFIWMVLSAFKTNADVYAYPMPVIGAPLWGILSCQPA